MHNRTLSVDAKCRKLAVYHVGLERVALVLASHLRKEIFSTPGILSSFFASLPFKKSPAIRIAFCRLSSV